MTEPGLLLVVSGPSGTGKGTICKYLLQRRPDMFLSVSATTRPRRYGEIEGINYYFKDKSAFDEMIARDEFLEWAEVYDNRYGTPKAPVTEAIASGKDVLLEIDIQGALKVKEKAPDGIYIFIVPPSLNQLRARIIGRGTDSMEVISKRLNKALGELAYLHEYNYVVVNDDVNDAVNRIESIIDAEKSKAQRYRLVTGCGPDDPLLVSI